MTDKIDEIRARHAAVDGCKWRTTDVKMSTVLGQKDWSGVWYEGGWSHGTHVEGDSIPLSMWTDVRPVSWNEVEPPGPNGTFIANSWRDVGYLLSEIDRLRKWV